jgi:hypothetical protein
MLDYHCFLALVWKLLFGWHQKTGSDWNSLEHVIVLFLYGVNLLGIKKNVVLRNTEKQGFIFVPCHQNARQNDKSFENT